MREAEPVPLLRKRLEAAREHPWAPGELHQHERRHRLHRGAAAGRRKRVRWYRKQHVSVVQPEDRSAPATAGLDDPVLEAPSVQHAAVVES